MPVQAGHLDAEGDFHHDHGAGNIYHIEPPADWVLPVTPFTSDSATGREPSPVGERLGDVQIDAREPGNVQAYYGYEYSLNTTDAVADRSTIEIEFDPSYEHLTLHHVLIKRGSRVLDKLVDARRHVLQRENELDALIYHGRKSLALVLRDVRVGDIINYAYTLSGENPIFGGLREFSVSTDWYVPVNRLHTRVLSRSKDDLTVRYGDTDVELIGTQTRNAYVMMSDSRDVPALQHDPHVPEWRRTQPYIVFSDIEGWGNVVDWEHQLYTPTADTPEELHQTAADIMANHIDPAARIGAALSWVQNEVRYFGVELGINSHLPSTPAETLARRFGDCKDKSALLVALLAQMGIKASPALVDSTRAIRREENPFRLHAFDHVIVHVELDGQSHWLDPTDTHQRGRLGEFSEPDYGKALILAAGVNALQSMVSGRETQRYAVTKTLTWDSAPATSATLVVKTQRFGAAAESARRSLLNEDAMQRRERYEDYYRDYFGPNNMLGKVAFSDLADNSLTTTEEYRLRDIWEENDNGRRELRIYADEISNSLELPDTPHRRTQPFQISHPFDITETWRLELPGDLHFDELEVSDHSAWMAFDKSYSLDSSTRLLTVTMRFRTLTDVVEVDDIDAYMKAVERIEDLASFAVDDTQSVAETTVVEKQGVAKWITMVNAVSIMTFVLLITLIVLFGVMRRMYNTIESTRESIADLSA